MMDDLLSILDAIVLGPMLDYATLLGLLEAWNNGFKQPRVCR